MTLLKIIYYTIWSYFNFKSDFDKLYRGVEIDIRAVNGKNKPEILLMGIATGKGVEILKEFGGLRGDE